jgi:proton-coupled amino acid transporter
MLAAFTLIGWLMLLKCKQQLAGNLPLSYGDVAAHVFGPNGQSIVNFFVVLTQLGICCVYFSFIATNLHAVLPSGTIFALRHLILLQIPLLVGLGSVIDLKNITPLSMAANIFFFFGLIIVFGYDEDSIEHPLSDTQAPHFSADGLAIFFGNAIYSFEGIGIVLPIENEMENPQEYPRLLMIAMAIIAVVYSLVGELTLLAFGNVTEGSATAEIALFHKDEWPVILCNLCIVISVAFTFPIQFFPAIQILENNLGIGGPVHSAASTAPKNIRERSLESCDVIASPADENEVNASSRTYCLRLVLRWLLITGCALTAYAIPNLGLLISLLGSIGSTALALILPVLLYWALMDLSTVTKCGLAVFLVFGLVCGCMSFAVAVKELVKSGGE